jgi:prepilin-type N-terminal cleavage/methylation domain-containing protein
MKCLRRKGKNDEFYESVRRAGPSRMERKMREQGFTFIEVLVVIAIIAIFLVVSYPSILNTMEVRGLENSARGIQSYLQQAKLRAVENKIFYRVRFTQVNAYWAYEMERAEWDGAEITWVKVGGAPRRDIPAKFFVTITLPLDGADYVVDFSPLGTIANFVTGQLNSIVIQSPKLYRLGRMDLRVLNLFMGGSIQYLKQKS